MLVTNKHMLMWLNAMSAVSSLFGIDRGWNFIDTVQNTNRYICANGKLKSHRNLHTRDNPIQCVRIVVPRTPDTGQFYV